MQLLLLVAPQRDEWHRHSAVVRWARPCGSMWKWGPAATGSQRFCVWPGCVYYSILPALSQRPHLLSEFRSFDKWVHPPDYFTHWSLVLRMITLILTNQPFLKAKLTGCLSSSYLSKCFVYCLKILSLTFSGPTYLRLLIIVWSNVICSSRALEEYDYGPLSSTDRVMLSASQGRACITELVSVDWNFDHDNYREQKAVQNHNIK